MMNRRKLLTVNYDTCLTRIEPIYNDIGTSTRRTRNLKRGRHGEDGEEHEKKCEGISDSEVHVCVSIETEY
jgi:hypothetical protein